MVLLIAKHTRTNSRIPELREIQTREPVSLPGSPTESIVSTPSSRTLLLVSLPQRAVFTKALCNFAKKAYLHKWWWHCSRLHFVVGGCTKRKVEYKNRVLSRLICAYHCKEMEVKLALSYWLLFIHHRIPCNKKRLWLESRVGGPCQDGSATVAAGPRAMTRRQSNSVHALMTHESSGLVSFGIGLGADPGAGQIRKCAISYIHRCLHWWKRDPISCTSYES